MSHREMIDRVLCEVAPLLDAEAVAGYEHDGEASWELAASSGRIVEYVLDENAGRLMLSTAVGTPRDDVAARIHKRLLQYNCLWRETSGVRMAIDHPGGEVYMLYDVPVAELDAELLRNIQQNFQAAADAWQTLISAAHNAEPLSESTNELFLRV